MTHGNKMFTQDDRFQLVREDKVPNDDEEDWVLIIRYVTARDTGIYECQASIFFIALTFVTRSV